MKFEKVTTREIRGEKYCGRYPNRADDIWIRYWLAGPKKWRKEPFGENRP